MKLNYKSYGGGEPLIIIHGLFGSLDNWQTLAKRFANDYEVFILDARNHGQSPHSNEFNYEVMALDLYEFILDHNLIDPIILGHSMGGKIAMQFAMDYSTIPKKLIIADIAPINYKVHHRHILDAMLALDFEKISSRQEADRELSKKITELSVRQFLLKNLYWKEKGRLDWRFNLKVINEAIIPISKGVSYTSIFNKPTLFIRGVKSDYIKEKDFDLIHQLFLQATIINIDAGHWVHAEKPNKFYDIVIEFLTD